MIPMLVGDEQVFDRFSANVKGVQLPTIMVVDQYVRKNHGLSRAAEIFTPQRPNSWKIPEIILQIIYPWEVTAGRT